MRVVCGELSALPASLLKKLGRYRYRVFIATLGWKLDAPGGIELDEFDRGDAVCVMVLDDASHVVGCARLLPTTKPYLLAKYFPHLLPGQPMPHCDAVWELSRFASMDFRGVPSTSRDQSSSPVTRLLLDAALTGAAARGAERLISVSPPGVSRLLSRLGVRARRAGPVSMIDGCPTFACWIDVATRPRLVDVPVQAPLAIAQPASR